MGNVHVVCFFASYLVAWVLEGVRYFRRGGLWRALSLAFGLAGLVAHTIYLVERSNKIDLPPLLSSNHDWLLVLAWMAVVFYLVPSFVVWLGGRNLPIGLFLLPIVLILIGASDLVGETPSAALSTVSDVTARDARLVALRAWSMFHASFLVFGIGGVIFGFVFSLWYLVQHRRLKHRQAGHDGLALPSLATLGRLVWWSVVVSIPLLTLGLLTGIPVIFLSRKTPAPISFNDPLIVGSAIAGMVMIAFFGWLLRAEQSGSRQFAWRTMWGFGFLLVTLIGLEVLTNGHAPAKPRAGGPAFSGKAPMETARR